MESTGVDLAEVRRTNGRAAIDSFGGVTHVARLMGYSNASWLVQIFGPNPTRKPSEKLARKMEAALQLASGTLDRAAVGDAAVGHSREAPGHDAANTGALNSERLTAVIALVLRVVEEESAQLSPGKLASLISIGYEDAAENGGAAREGKLRQLVQLLR